MTTYTKEQIENVWFALNLNRRIPNNEAYSGAGLHNPNRSINMYKWLQDALTFIGVGPISLPLNTKGDILTYTTTLAKLGVGSNGQVLTVHFLFVQQIEPWVLLQDVYGGRPRLQRFCDRIRQLLLFASSSVPSLLRKGAHRGLWNCSIYSRSTILLPIYVV